MDRNDWIDLLAPKLQRTYIDPASPTIALLDTRIPAACPDCKGDVGYITEHLEPCFCPNAPTVEQVLTVGLRTLHFGEEAFPWSWHDEKIKPDDPMAAYWLGADRMLNYLRTGRALRGEDA